MSPAGRVPAAVDALDGALGEWLAAFTMPEPLAEAMAEACAAGAAWPAAIAAVSARRAGWEEIEAMAWGIAVGALAGALEATRASLAPAGAAPATGAARARATDGPARPLLAADGLVAAAHEALSSLPPDRLSDALGALDDAFGAGRAWTALARDPSAAPLWPALVPSALAPAIEHEPGDWEAIAEAWAGAIPAREGDGDAPGDSGRPGDTEWSEALWRGAGDPSTTALLRAAARAARLRRPA